MLGSTQIQEKPDLMTLEEISQSRVKDKEHQTISPVLTGARFELSMEDTLYPASFQFLKDPPKKIYGIGNPESLKEGLAIVGARKATPYGISCARFFGRLAAELGIVIISGGAYGCDTAAHHAALDAKNPTVVVLGGGCDKIYPESNYLLFQEIVDSGGAVISENDWNADPLPYTFRKRNRLIATLAKATLIVEAGLPSGTFSTADAALAANRDVLVVPGSITSPQSRGANRLMAQGAIPIVDEESFYDAMFDIFGCLKPTDGYRSATILKKMTSTNPFIEAVIAQPSTPEDLLELARQFCGSYNPYSWMAEQLIDAEAKGIISQYPNGKYGATARFMNL